jgi:hypothetical protein
MSVFSIRLKRINKRVVYQFHFIEGREPGTSKEDKAAQTPNT